MTPPSRVLLVRLRSLGDAVLMTPVLTVLKRNPGTRVAVLLEAPFHEVLANNPQVDRIITVPRGRSKLMTRSLAIRAARSFSPDMAVDLHGGTTSALITALSGAAVRIGYSSSRSRRFYNRSVPDSRRIWGKVSIHTVEHQLAPFKHLGFQVEPIPPLQVPVEISALDQVRTLLSRSALEEGFILIHPGAAFDTKQWEPGRFAEISRLLEREGHPIVFTAGPGEEPLLADLGKAAPASVHFLGPLPLDQFIALASLCRLYLGNDTGTTHIATALGKPVVVIFGSSDSPVWSPWGTRHRLIRTDLPCIPCPGYYCLHYQEPMCIRSITVPRVLEAVRSLLRESACSEFPDGSASPKQSQTA